VCCGDTPLVELVDAKIVRIRGGPCSHKTFLYHVVSYPPFDWVQEQSTFQACWRNELVSLQQRHLITEGEPELEEWMRCVTIAEDTTSLLGPLRRATPEEVVAHKGSPAARKRYTEAFASIDAIGAGANATRVSAFVKVEKWERDKIVPIIQKAPRSIQFRSYKYCGRLSTILLPLEKALWALEVDGLCPFAKNMNTFRVASTLKAMSDRFVDPIYVLLDHAKFDSCITIPWIALEEAFYRKATGDSELRELMESQILNRGYTKGGIRYECVARKMSGEYNTSLGDTLVNYTILTDVFRNVRHQKLLNGDDSVVILEKDDLRSVDISPETWKRYGFKTTVEVVDEFEKIDFCQARPIEIRTGVWRMVRVPSRAIGRSCVSVKRYEHRAWYALVAALGYSELACGDGVPMMQAWANLLMRSSLGATPLASEVSRRAKLERRVTESKIVTDLARLSFFRAFGMTHTQQLDFEEWCDNQTLRVLPATEPDDRLGL
jgi:hypothetical protein